MIVRTGAVNRNRKQSMAVTLLQQRRSAIFGASLRRQTLVPSKQSVEIRLSDMSSASEIDRGRSPAQKNPVELPSDATTRLDGSSTTAPFSFSTAVREMARRESRAPNVDDEALGNGSPSRRR
uniref:Uncharacterized protein n=1 Tax=Plectus sambesii TaxID=2011161 RepID=A0A914WP13_9BILA